MALPRDLLLLNRVLVRLPTWLGDTVMAIPTLRAIRCAWPSSEITLVGPYAKLLFGQALADRAVNEPRSWGGRMRHALKMRARHFDLAILLPNSFSAAWLAWLGGSRRRLGFKTDGRRLLLTHAVTPPHGLTHQVEAYLGLVEAIGIEPVERTPRLTVDERLLAEADLLMRSAGVEGSASAVGIQLGAAFGPTKRWIPERIAELAARLSGISAEPLLLGPRDEAALARWIIERSGAPVRSLVGLDTPELLPAILARCRVVVSADSGPAHLAAAVGTPAITIFGPTDPRRTGPLGQNQIALWAKVPCSPCFLARCPIDHVCMTSISVDEVLANIEARLKERVA